MEMLLYRLSYRSTFSRSSSVEIETAMIVHSRITGNLTLMIRSLSLGEDAAPGDLLERSLNSQVSLFDECVWMMWRKPVKTTGGTAGSQSTNATNTKILLQKLTGSVADLLQEFDSQWASFRKHSFITRQQAIYIRQIKLDADEYNSIIVHIDFAENYTLLNQKQIMQAHWTTPQATIFTVHIRINKEKQQSVALISDYLEHDVEFVHTAQGIITDYVLSVYPSVRRLNYVSDGAGQHFKNNKNILNLTHHHSDFGISALWTFCATAHGKSAVDGIGAAIKHRATKRVLSGKPTDAILTPEDLFKFCQQDTIINVFYVSKSRVKQNSERYRLQARWKHGKLEGKDSLVLILFPLEVRESRTHIVSLIGWVDQIRSQHQFDPVAINKVTCRRTSTSTAQATSELIR